MVEVSKNTSYKGSRQTCTWEGHLSERRTLQHTPHTVPDGLGANQTRRHSCPTDGASSHSWLESPVHSQGFGVRNQWASWQHLQSCHRWDSLFWWAWAVRSLKLCFQLGWHLQQQSQQGPVGTHRRQTQSRAFLSAPVGSPALPASRPASPTHPSALCSLSMGRVMEEVPSQQLSSWGLLLTELHCHIHSILFLQQQLWTDLLIPEGKTI